MSYLYPDYYGLNPYPVHSATNNQKSTSQTVTNNAQYDSTRPVDNSEGMSTVEAVGLQTAMQNIPKAIMESDIGEGVENAYRMGKGFLTGGIEGYNTARDAAMKSVGERASAEAITAGGTEAAGKAAKEAATKSFGGIGNSAMSGFGGAIATDLLTKGKVDKDTMLKGGAAMAANMLLPGSGVLAAPLMSVLGLKGGTEFVPYRQDLMGSIGGYNDGTVSVPIFDMSTDNITKDFIPPETNPNASTDNANKIDNVFDNRVSKATNIETSDNSLMTTSGETKKVAAKDLKVGEGPLAGTSSEYEIVRDLNDPLHIVKKQQQQQPNMMLPLGGLLAATLLAKATEKKKKK